MKTFKIEEFDKIINVFGRCYKDCEEQALFMNWSCSGVEFQFKGKLLQVELLAKSSDENDDMFSNDITKIRTIWPWIGIILDDKEEIYKKIEINQSKDVYTLFESDTEENHKIRIVKLTENSKGKVGLSALITDGILSQSEKTRYPYQLEFIGDSITSAFGNETLERDKLFYSEDENAWMSHAAIAARKLNAAFHLISVSGITVGNGVEFIPGFDDAFPRMEQLYEYTDRIYEIEKGKTKDFTKWEFSSYQPDAVVLNLGTNDHTQLKIIGEIENGERKFEQNYRNIIQFIRDKNGPDTLIVCALGTMDYYLYDNILRVVEEYQKDTGDRIIRCMKYSGQRFDDGLGACSHPSKATQIRMGEELALKLSKWLSEVR